MDPTKPLIQFDHFRLLCKVDQGKRCPKLKTQHLELNSALKMRVSLATQVNLLLIRKQSEYINGSQKL